MLAKSLLSIALGFVAAVTAQISGNAVTVYANNTEVVVSQDGHVLTQSYLESAALTSAGLFTECGGTLVLNNTIDQTAAFTFSGTAIQVTFITCDSGGVASLYLDGTFWETINTYSDAVVTACTVGRATNVNLAETSHTITIVNNTPLNRTHIQSFQYVPYAAVPPSVTAPSTGPAPSQSIEGSGSGSASSSSSNSSSTSKKSSLAPIIGGAVGGVVVVAIAIIAILFFRRHHNQARQTTTTNNNNNYNPHRPDILGGGGGVVGAGGSVYEPKDHSDTASGYNYYNNSPYLNNPPTPSSAAAPPPLPPAPAPGNVQLPLPLHMPMANPNYAASDTWSQRDRRNSFTAGSTISLPSQAGVAQGSLNNNLRAVNPGSPRPLPEAPSPAYTESIVSGGESGRGVANLTQHRASQLDVVQQLLNRGVPAAEITSVIRMMSDQGGAASTSGVGTGIVSPGSPPPPQYGDEKAGLRGL